VESGGENSFGESGGMDSFSGKLSRGFGGEPGDNSLSVKPSHAVLAGE
jgi:hypothetical protein